MNSLDSVYINKISTYLRNFKSKSGKLFNFSCHFCGDSEKHKKKARAYLFEKAGQTRYYCHNCGHSTSLKGLIKDIDYVMYKEYLKETLSHTDQKIPKDLLKPNLNIDNSIFKELQLISDLDRKHYARQYLIGRKIPTKWHNKMYFCPTFREFTNKQIPDKFDSIKGDPRILIPFYTESGVLFGYQGRALYETKARYITIILNDDYNKFWGLNFVNKNKQFYITEGPLDAMCLENAIAICGSDIQSGLNSLKCDYDKITFVYDNEPRNSDIVRKMQSAVNKGIKICIWPDYLETGGDINEYMKNGLTASEVQAIIDNNLYTGMKAQLRLNEWKKI